jgi:hypothetical protein
MSFAKYCALLRTRKLHFGSTALFDDHWEGSHGMWYGAGVDLISLATRVSWSGMALNEFSSRWNRWVRGWTFANCWHMNELDSEAMWKLYANDEGAVAIQSTYARLRAVLPADVGIGRVYYIDYYASPPTPHPFKGYPNPFVFKRKSLQHERELRALVQRLPTGVGGDVNLWASNQASAISFTVDLAELVESVHVQPGAPHWLAATVADVTAKYTLDVVVDQARDEALF